MSTLVKYEEQKQKLTTFRELATIAIKSGSYRDLTVESAMNLMLSAADLGVSPMKALNGGFHIIKGKIVMAGHLISDRIRGAGHSIKVIEHTKDKCVIIGKRRDNEDSYKCEFDIDEARSAGIAGSEVWKKYPKDMLYNRCIARLGRVLFSDVVGACYSEDEGHDIKGTPIEDRRAEDPDTINIEVMPQEMPRETNCRPVTLHEHVENAGLNPEFLNGYLEGLAAKKNISTEEVITSALMPEILPRFLDFYKSYVNKQSEGQKVA